MSAARILKIYFIIMLSVLAVCLLLRTTVEAERNAPDFTLNDLQGKQVSLNDYRGKTVLLDFWATWCAPCRMAAPELIKIQKNYRHKGLVVLAISLDDRDDCDDRCLLDYKRQQKLNFKVLRGDLKILVDYFNNPGIPIPTSIIVDKQGRIVSEHHGYIPGLMEKELKKLLQ